MMRNKAKKILAAALTLVSAMAMSVFAASPTPAGITVKVDGKDAPITLVGDCMVAVELQQGDHEVSFRYHNPAFSLGWKITLAAFVIFGLLVWKQHPVKLLPEKKGKFQK